MNRVALRLALGATRGRLISAQLAEAVIATLAGLLAVGLAWLGVPLLLGRGAISLTLPGLISYDGR